MAARATMDWDKLKVFHAAAEAGSFTHAGEQLGLSQSAVSRQVSALEQELSVALFHRQLMRPAPEPSSAVLRTPDTLGTSETSRGPSDTSSARLRPPENAYIRRITVR